MVTNLTTRQRKALEQPGMHSKKVMKCRIEFRSSLLTNCSRFFFFIPSFYLKVKEPCFRKQSGVIDTYIGYEAHNIVL